MKRPAFQFYVGDWQSNTNLRRCTFAEKGIWIEVMCLMHDAEQYGVLRWPLKEIAQAVGCKLPELKSLVTKGVLKGSDAKEECGIFVYTPRSGGKDGESVTLIPAQPGPLWYSSRMVKDEYVSKNRGKGTRFGEQKTSPNPDDRLPPIHRVGVKSDEEPSHRIEDGPSFFDLQSSPSEGKKEQMDRAEPEDAAPPDLLLAVIQVFDDARAEVFGMEVRRLFPAGDDKVFAERFLAAGATLEWLKAFFLERMAKRKKSGHDATDGLRYFADAIPEALQRIAAAKSTPQAQIIQAATKPVQRTPEEQAKYDAEQVAWFRNIGKQHPTYNPEGLTVKGASA